MGAILDGKGLSEQIQAQVAREVANLKAQGIFPKLCVILVGENPASISYVNMKNRACERTGIESLMLKFDENISQEFLLGEIARLNADKSVSGILVQLPLPKHIDTSAILEAIDVQKDVDGFHPYNVGRLVASMANSACSDFSGSASSRSLQRTASASHSLVSHNPENSSTILEFADSAKSNDSSLRGESQDSPKQSTTNSTQSMPILAPATPLGVMELLKAYDIEVSGKNVAIIGASNIVGKPLSALMLNAGATISVCHILTKDISVFTKSADIVCVGVGKVNLITADMIKNGAIVIDIGINKVDGKIKGDVDFESVSKKASFITPVPGGVGPMTIAMLLKNTLLCAQILHKSTKSHISSLRDSQCESKQSTINLVVRSTTKSRPLRGAKNRIQTSSSASADFLLEAEKRGSPPKSEKAAAFWRVGGAGRGVQPFLRENSSESNAKSGKNLADSPVQHCDSNNLDLRVLDCFGESYDSPRNDGLMADSRDLDSSLRTSCYAQNDGADNAKSHHKGQK